MASIFVRINADVNAGGLTDLITGQLRNLTSANTELTRLTGGQPAGLTDIVGLLGDLELPDTNLSGSLSTGFSSLQNLIPSDPSSFTGELSTAVERIFSGLNVNLIGQLTGFINGFKAIHELTQIDFRIKVEVEAVEGGESGGTVGAALADPDDDGGIEAAFASVSALLAFLPDPLNVASVLSLILGGVSAFPREIYPLSYLPLADELKDKLETTLAWREMSGEQLSAELSANLSKLALSLRNICIAGGVQPVADQITAISSHVDDVAIKDSTDAIIEELNILAAKVRAGNLSDTAPHILTLDVSVARLREALTDVKENLLEGQSAELDSSLTGLGDKLDGRALQLFSNLDPPSDFEIIKMLVDPVNRLIDQAGFDTLNDKIREFLGAFRSLLDSLNLTTIKDEITGVIDGAVSAVGELNTIITGITVNFSLVIDQIESAIDAVGIEQVVTGIENLLQAFQTMIDEQVNAVFEPVRNLLLSTFSTINGSLSSFNPKLVIDELVRLIQTLTNILSDPVLLDTIETLRNGLDSINEELGKFSFKPTTDTIVDLIGVVKEALSIASSLPLPDGLKSQLEDALGVLPETIRPATTTIGDELGNIVEDGPAAILLAIKDQPAKLVKLVEAYSPEKLIGDKLSRPYNEFLATMERYHPSALLEPVQDVLDDLKERVDEVANPKQFFDPLVPPFNQLLESFDAFDPHKLIEPIQQQITAGIHAITSQLPLEATNDIFDHIAEITGKAREGLAVGMQFRDLLQDIKERLGGMADAEAQVEAFINEITSKLDGVTDISSIGDAVNQIRESVESIKAAPLKALLNEPAGALVARLNALQPKTRMVNLISAQRGFPRAQLNALPDSPEKTALVELLNGFDPMDASFTAPLDALDRLPPRLQTAKANLETFFTDWDTTYHRPNSPLTKLSQLSVTVPALKQMLGEAIRKQLAEPLSGVFKIVEHFSALLDTTLAELVSLLDDLDAKITEMLSITDSLEEIRVAINHLVDTINGFNITFLADEIDELFGAVKTKLETLNPAHIGAAVEETFNHLLDLLNVNALLGADELDREFDKLLALLRSLDPKVLVTDAVQPEYDKILDFLKKLDMSQPIETFVARLLSLVEELKVELDRVADAYEEMIDNVPSELDVQFSVSVSVSA
jgi:hypothetical protein